MIMVSFWLPALITGGAIFALTVVCAALANRDLL